MQDSEFYRPRHPGRKNETRSWQVGEITAVWSDIGRFDSKRNPTASGDWTDNPPPSPFRKRRGKSSVALVGLLGSLRVPRLVLTGKAHCYLPDRRDCRDRRRTVASRFCKSAFVMPATTCCPSVYAVVAAAWRVFWRYGSGRNKIKINSTTAPLAPESYLLVPHLRHAQRRRSAIGQPV